MAPKISVIVPVYNSEAFLERCLDTLVNQTLEDVEIVVVNDGSPDDSQAIIDRYAAKYPEKIVPFIKENGGLSDARNFGIARATGEYIGFVDSDDFVDLDMYQRLYAKATQTDSDVVCHPLTNSYPTERARHSFRRGMPHFGKSVAESPRILVHANSFAVNKIYRRLFWLDGGFAFPVGQLFEDSAVVYNILYAANRVEAVDLPFYYYEREVVGSITASANERIYDIFKSCDSILSYYRSKPEYSTMKEWVEFVCLRHLFVRFDLLAREENRQFVSDFVAATYGYLDREIPDWRANYYFDSARHGSPYSLATNYIRQHPTVAKPYYGSARGARKRLHQALAAGAKATMPVRRRRAASAASTPKPGVSIAPTIGPQLITLVHDVLERSGFESFADFGTLARLIADGRLGEQETSVSMGVILTEPLDAMRVRLTLERAGLKCVREYYHGGNALMAYYRLAGVPINVYYYVCDDNTARTWTFFSDPARPLEPGQRNVAELRTTAIRGVERLDVDGTAVPIPLRARKLLFEKFGREWRTPPAEWMPSNSPAAVTLDGPGSYISYRYPGRLNRADDVELRGLYEDFYDSSLNPRNDASGELREIQEITLNVLKEVDRVCRENDITYYLGEGTLLGAIRNHGFIPWDDDIDILMERSEYDRFLRVAPRAIRPEYRVEHQTLLPTYWSAFMKVRAIGETGYTQSTITHLTDHHGPYVDIFPLDSVPDRESPKQAEQEKLFNRYRRSLSFKTGINSPKTFKTRLTKTYSRFVSVPFLFGKIEETSRMLESPGNSYLVNLASLYSARSQTFPREWFGQPRYVRFENAEFPVPAQSERILETVYGPSYMSPPNIENRATGHNWTRTPVGRSQSSVRPGAGKPDGRVLKVGPKEIVGELRVSGADQTSRAALFVDDLEVDSVLVPHTAGAPTAFRFPVREMWQYCGRDNAVSVRVNGLPLQMPDGQLGYSSSTAASRPLAELVDRLASGEIVNSLGGLSMPKYLDAAWQQSATDLYRELRSAVRDIAGYDTFLIYGSLLGAVREGRPIGHDCDFDCAYLSSHRDVEAVKQEVGELALALQERGLHVEARVNCMHVSNSNRTHRIDLYHVFFNTQDELRLAWGTVSPTPFTLDQWHGLVETEFAGSTVLIPKYAEPLVATLYGSDWRIPKPGFDWSRERSTRAEDAAFPKDLRPIINWQDYWSYAKLDSPSGFARFVLEQSLDPQLVVDLGCGDGRDAPLFLRAGARVVGLDQSTFAIDSARARYLSADRARFAVCDLAERGALGQALSDEELGNAPRLFYARQLLDCIPDANGRALLADIAALARPGDSVALEFRGLADDTLTAHHVTSCGRHGVDIEPIYDWAESTGFDLSYDDEETSWEHRGSKGVYLHRVIATKKPD